MADVYIEYQFQDSIRDNEDHRIIKIENDRSTSIVDYTD